MNIQFPDEFRQRFPRQFDIAWHVTQDILGALPRADLSTLARHSPGLKGYDWTSYLRLSIIRMLHIGAALERAASHGRLLDFGSYFSNFALFFRRLGFDVDAADNYADYGPAFDPFLQLSSNAGVNTIDLGEERAAVSELPRHSYDVVLLLGVIEHVPHTPRPLLLALDQLLRPGGTLIIETPNLAYLYKREQLASGQSIFPPIETQFFTELPFEGHHREYTTRELRWMLEQIGHERIEIETFNYSLYGLSELQGRDAEFFHRMEADPELRELILSRSVKP